ncbi:MAG TPA: ABC transporter permease [Microbacteriaceae bacterium]|nr:ABC transporter permease [Microbacteriaceae bacterium]
MSNQSLSSGHEGNLRDQFTAYVQRVRGGEMGSLPALSALVALGILFSSLSPYFLTNLNFANLFTQAAQLAVLAMGLVFVLLLAEIDLSAGVTGATGMGIFVILTLRMGWDPVLALVVSFVFGVLVGALIGFFVARVGVPSFVITLGLFLGFQGVLLIMLGDGGIFRVDVEWIKAIQNENLPAWGGWTLLGIVVVVSLLMGLWDRSRRARAGLVNKPISILWIKVLATIVIGGIAVYILNENRSVSIKPISGVPIVIPVVIAILFIGTFVLDRTRYGRHLYAVGGNPEAARRAGIKVAMVRVTAFMICSGLAVFSGLLQTSRLGTVESTAGRTIVLTAVAAAVVGGVSLFGGRGRLSNAIVGAFVLAMIDNGLGLIGLPAGINFLVTGGVLAAAATIDALSRKRSGGART